MSKKRRGVPWSRIAQNVERVLLIRYAEIATRTDEVNKWGLRIWIGQSGHRYGFHGMMYVKPVYKYAQIFGELQ